MVLLLIPISFIPIFFYLIDAYFAKDLKKGLAYIIAFFSLEIIGITMLNVIG